MYIKENVQHTSSIHSNTYTTATQAMEFSYSIEARDVGGKKKMLFPVFHLL